MAPMEQAKAAVDGLYFFRDHYFEDHSLENAINRTQDLEAELQKTLFKLQTLEEAESSKAEFLMLKGKALNILHSYSPKAQDALQKSVKLDPRLAEAWVHLGECYWKNQDVNAAKDCFEGALSHGKDKVALRNLSMVLRQVGSNQAEKIKNVEDGVEKAKQAIQLDIKDGTSWFILGNAYLSLFFGSTQSAKLLKQCLSAYQQAERDPVAMSCPDLHFNRATAYKYQEEYELALMGFNRAVTLDPKWTDAEEQESHLLGYLRKLQDLVHNKGKLRDKKLKSLTSSIRDADLGPYGGGSYETPKGKTVKLEHIPFSDLHSDLNTEKVIAGKVICSVQHTHPVPLTVCLMDKAGSCIAVSVYNLAAEYGLNMGDSVAIPEPFVQNVDFRYKDESFKFPSVRVSSPVVMVINGRKLGIERQAPSVLTVKAMIE